MAAAARHAARRAARLGAGAGRNTPRYTGYEKITLLDYSRTQLEQARARLGDNPNLRFVAADVYRLPFVEGAFDGATMIRTLHQVTQAKKASAKSAAPASSETPNDKPN